MTSLLASVGLFPASALGVWDGLPTHNVGPAINHAIAAARLCGGGTVVLPPGTFYLATPIWNVTSFVRLQGAGIGASRDTSDYRQFIAGTRLIWNGMAGATMCDISPAPGPSAQTLFDCGLDGIVFDGAALAGICLRVAQVSFSRIRAGVAEPRSIGALLTTEVTSDAGGFQNNDVSLYSRATAASDAFHPTGIMLDSVPGSAWDVSGNHFRILDAWYNSGDGVVVGASDNNLFDELASYPEPGVASGSAVVFASAGYASPNGVKTIGQAYCNRVLHTMAPVVCKGSASGLPSTDNLFEFVDQSNAQPAPVFEPGATGSYWFNMGSVAPVRVG